jgi:2-polyprenyl-3-methyl-5-hydroxy-6-metoxy-1,4-benzoquinol methylase
MPEIAYPGSELEVFAQAINWKRYIRKLLLPYLRGRVLEVGAGIGGTTRVLCQEHRGEWVCLEPDPALSGKADVPSGVVWMGGSLADLPARELFDCILYLDVLEHIEDDRGELERARDHLVPGGTVAVAGPAHQWLYTPFDARIGHHRRYTKAGIRGIGLAGMTLELLRYTDTAGLLASGANRALLRQSEPSLRQVLFWDRVLVPCSRLLDPILRYTLGKSLLAVWRKPA